MSFVGRQRKEADQPVDRRPQARRLFNRLGEYVDDGITGHASVYFEDLGVREVDEVVRGREVTGPDGQPVARYFTHRYVDSDTGETVEGEIYAASPEEAFSLRLGPKGHDWHRLFDRERPESNDDVGRGVWRNITHAFRDYDDNNVIITIGREEGESDPS